MQSMINAAREVRRAVKEALVSTRSSLFQDRYILLIGLVLGLNAAQEVHCVVKEALVTTHSMVSSNKWL